MHHLSPAILAMVLLLLARVPATADPPANSQTTADEKLLKETGIGVDGAALLDFLRKHTPSTADERHVEALVRRLSDRTFRVRQQATDELVRLGPKALWGLRQALEGADLETQRRAEHCIRLIDRRCPAAALAAGARLLSARRPPGTCAALLGAFPAAADEDVEDEILAALVAVGVRDGKADPALTAVLHEGTQAQRAACGRGLCWAAAATLRSARLSVAC